MKAICFFNSTKAWGGGEKWHFDMARKLYEEGYDVLFVAGKGSVLISKLLKTNIPHYMYKIGNLSFLNFFLIRELKTFFRKHGVGTVIMNLSIDVKVAGVAAKKAGVQNIIYRRGSAIPIKNKFYNRYLFSHIITEIIANSEATKSTILQNNSKLFPEEKIKVIYNGLDFSKRKEKEPSPVYLREKDEIVLGNAGRMVFQKGHEYLIDVAVKLKSMKIRFKLLLAGTGPMESKIRELVRQNNLTQEVEFLGFVEDVGSFMRSIDIFLLTSRWEGFGFVIAEAMAESKPVVAFDISSNPELVVDNFNGYLSPPFDIDIFTDKTLELIRSEKLRKEFGKNGQAMAYEKFSFEKAVTELKNFLELKEK